MKNKASDKDKSLEMQLKTVNKARRASTKKMKVSEDVVVESNEFHSLFTDYDIDLFKAGKHYHLYNKLGSKVTTQNGVKGTYFAVWAPNAKYIAVIGNFNGWNRGETPMTARWDGSGIWETFVPNLGKESYYKYFLVSNNGHEEEKGDPYAYHWETPPHTASVVWDFDFKWSDKTWMNKRKKDSALNKPMSVYEIHLGSWRKVPEEGGRFMSYREMARELPAYCQYMGFTHVEMMPVMEHPFFGSWGYQVTGYFAPSSRFGTPEDFMYLVNELHRANIGVILDWVPSHFPVDKHGPAFFDGTHLYEHEDPKLGFHPDWKSNIFNYGRNEVRGFLISNALYWLDKYHIDGLRVDAVASMLYLDYSRNEGEWIPNKYGGRENLEAISLLQEFNDAVHNYFPDVFTAAEESTSYQGVTHPTSGGGLGFDLKWMMGWMHDSLSYFKQEPVYRSYHHNQITFSLHYAYSEKYVLPLSHDEVVHGKKSLIDKMPGDPWQQFANLRLLYAYMIGHPGAKLIFMGGEFGQGREWQHDYSLEWHENHNPLNHGLQSLVKALNELYQEEKALYELNYSPEGFEWISIDDSGNSVLSWIRKGKNPEDQLIFVANFTPVVRSNYRIGVPVKGEYTELLSSDDLSFGGSDVKNHSLTTYPIPRHGKTHSLSLILPPLGVTVLKLKSAQK